MSVVTKQSKVKYLLLKNDIYAILYFYQPDKSKDI